MPRLSLEQPEQAIGNLNAGQQAIAQAFNCNVHACTIQLLLECYNVKNSINDRSLSGRYITPLQDRCIFGHHTILSLYLCKIGYEK